MATTENDLKKAAQKSTFKSGILMAALAASQIDFLVMVFYPFTRSTEVAE